MVYVQYLVFMLIVAISCYWMAKGMLTLRIRVRLLLSSPPLPLASLQWGLFLWNKRLQGFFLAKHGIQELTCWIAWGTSQAWVWCPCQRGQCLSLTSLKKIRMYTELPLPLRKMADISCIIIVSHFDGNSFVKHLEWPVAVKVAREMQVFWSSKSFLNCDTDPSISVYHWLSKQPESEHFTKCMLHNVKASGIWQLPFANTLNPCYNIELNISFLYYVNPYSLVHIKVHITA